ncbi:MAG: magnesium transporter [Actinomycetota bacterium]
MAFPRRARRLWGYWRAEQRTLRQGFVALLLSTAAGFVAALTLGSITGTLEALPGLLILIPASVGMRGTIFGAIGARLGTSTHAGLFEVTFDRAGILYGNVYVGIISTFSSSLYLAALASLAAAAFGESAISFWELVTISVVGGALGSALILLVTVGLSVLSYRRGYDLDAVATPMVTALGDMATLPTLFLATLLVKNDVVNGVSAGLCLAVCLYATVRGAMTDLKGVRRILLEMTPVILLTPLLDILAGTLLESRSAGFAVFPGILVLIPPFVSQAGALGGILSSRLSSKLQLGVISPRGRPEPPALVDVSLVVGFGMVVFTLIGTVALGLSRLAGLAHPGAGVMIGGALLAGLMAMAITIVVGYYLAIITSRFGLDPDNHGVPIITSVMDLSGVACVLFAMSILGAAIHG